jgi:hypothetical protein
MAKKDAIFDYSGAFDITPYQAGMKTDCTTNSSSYVNTRHDIHWSGDPAASAASLPAERAGWENGMWKVLSMYDIPVGSYSKDFEAPTWTHKFIADIKTAFNLPNAITMSSWKNEYSETANQENNYFWIADKDRVDHPMMITGPGTTAQRAGSIHSSMLPKCALVATVVGEGDDPSVCSCPQTVWPTSTNATTLNNHYTTLVDANTAAGSYTDPTKVGSEFTMSSILYLQNYENYFKETANASRTTDTITFIMSFSQDYATIKALIDAAIA